MVYQCNERLKNWPGGAGLLGCSQNLLINCSPCYQFILVHQSTHSKMKISSLFILFAVYIYRVGLVVAADDSSIKIVSTEESAGKPGGESNREL